MRKFVALPVAGDAFLVLNHNLKRPRPTRNILVDSGGSGKNLAQFLDEHLSPGDRIDIAVCTHADSDHANGFTSLLDEWRKLEMKKEKAAAKAGKAPRKIKTTKKTKVRLIGQFWLPGTWCSIVRDVLKDPEEFANGFYEETKKFRRLRDEKTMDHESEERERILNADGRDDLEEEFEPPSDSEFTDQPIGKGLEPEWIENARKDFKENGHNMDDISKAIRSVREKINKEYHPGTPDRSTGTVLIQLLDAAEKILKIVVSAFHNDVPIRWFDYEKFTSTERPSGGDPKHLVPINSVETCRTFKTYKKVGLLYLSTANVQCLSFYSPGYPYNPGILFCGDSPMGYEDDCLKPFKPPKPITSDSVIVTAPHHGSKNNQIAYFHICNQFNPVGPLGKLFWVRSGTKKNDPGQWYREIPSQYRICTLCPYNNLPPVAAELISCSSSAYPSFVPFGHRCTC